MKSEKTTKIDDAGSVKGFFITVGLRCNCQLLVAEHVLHE